MPEAGSITYTDENGVQQTIEFNSNSSDVSTASVYSRSVDGI